MLEQVVRSVKIGAKPIQPRCPHHARPGSTRISCGGCGWQILDHESQLRAKREIVRDCLFKIAKLREPRVSDTLASPQAWRYRNKVMVPFGRSNGATVAGFYATGTHTIVPFQDCPVQPELSVRITRTIRDLAGRYDWRTYDRARDTGWLRHVFIRTNHEGRALLTLVTRNGGFPHKAGLLRRIQNQFPEVAGIYQNVQPKKTPVVLGPKWNLLWGEEFLEERLGRLRLRVGPASFLQVNTPACEVLYGCVESFLTEREFRPEIALDLYSGIGSIALWIARSADKVFGMESNRRAVADAQFNARLNEIRNVRFKTGDVDAQGRYLVKTLAGHGDGTAAAVLDPPRAGCSKSALKVLRSPAFGRIVYVSCNPATFARDADWLARHRWRLSKVQPVDLFPQTSHVEVVGLFERGRSAHPRT